MARSSVNCPECGKRMLSTSLDRHLVRYHAKSNPTLVGKKGGK